VSLNFGTRKGNIAVGYVGFLEGLCGDLWVDGSSPTMSPVTICSQMASSVRIPK
jgi:hypothetical protein